MTQVFPRTSTPEAHHDTTRALLKRAHTGRRCLGISTTRSALFMWRPTLFVSCVAVVLGSTLEAHTEPRIHSRWSDRSALTIPAERLELGVLSASSYAPSKRVQLDAHAATFFVLPHLSAKLRWFDETPWTLSTRHQLTLPTPFLDLVAREGSLGLLPPDHDVPWAAMLDSELLLTRRMGPETFITLAAGAEVAGRTAEPVLLDFPFLYQRFAALNAPAIPHASLDVVTHPDPHLELRVHSTYWWLPVSDFEPGYAWESELLLGWSFTPDLRVAVAAQVAVARFPVGVRWHWLPWLDLRCAW